MSKREKSQGKVGGNKSAIVAALPAACSNERLAVEFMEAQRWGDQPECPLCSSTNIYQMRDRETGARNKRYLWRCRTCRQQYTVKVGSVMEDSRIPLMHWCYAFWAACASKKGVSALQIKRQTGLSYKSALFLMHRVRFAMADDQTQQPKLSGVVEADETYVGGRPRYRQPGRLGRKPGDSKGAVFALVQRGGRVYATAGDRISQINIRGALQQYVEQGTRLMTDESPIYRKIGRYFPSHETVNHTNREYVRGDVHTNTVEGFFSLIKRGVYGTFHQVSRRHLHRYVAEFAFRYNTRGIDDGQRTQLAIRSAEGKRLRYREPVRLSK